MMRAVTFYGAALLLLLGTAWVRWTSESDVDIEGKVMILQGEVDQIESITWTTDDELTVLTIREDDLGSYLWGDYTKWKDPEPEPEPEPLGPEAPSPDDDEVAEEPESASDPTPSPESAAEEPGEEQTSTSPEVASESPVPESEPAKVASADPGERVEDKHQVFKCGNTGDKLLNSLSPLLAIRKLEAVDEGKLEAIGLDSPSETLELVRRGKSYTLEVGGEAYGTRDRYVRHSATGEIYLVDDEVFRPLKYARTRLPDRSLWPFEVDKIVSATISDVQQTLEVEQLYKDDSTKAQWVSRATPDEENKQLDTWMDKALKLKASSYADGEVAGDSLEPRFTLELHSESGDKLTLEVLQEPEDGAWFARSPHTRGLVKLLTGPTSALAEDVESLVER